MNIELKARLSNLQDTKRKVEALENIRFEADDRQTDTFYNIPRGRLKLRESTFYGNILIPYLRVDNSAAKQSDYTLIEVKYPEALKRLFIEMFGIKIIVKKRRLIYLYENVRIHLDRVEHLGDFLEFEAVLDGKNNAENGRRKIAFLRAQLNINDEDLVSTAYADLILHR